MQNESLSMARLRLRLALVAILAWAALAVTHARAETALDFAVSGMGRQEAAHTSRHARVSRRIMRRVATHESRVRSPLDIRSAPQIVADAMRYVGSRNPTRFKGIAWCKAFVNKIAHENGYYVNASLRAIDAAAMGQRIAGPAVGAYRVTRHHVAIVASVHGGRVVAVSGNGRGHRVSLSHYAARGAAYYMPIRVASR